jgi:hypothetical protein
MFIVFLHKEMIMKSSFLLVGLFISLHGFVCGMDDYHIADPVLNIKKPEACGSSSFYYRNSPKTTTFNFDPVVVPAKEVVKDVSQDCVVGRHVRSVSKRKVSFSSDTIFPERESKKVGLVASVLDCLIQ